MGSLNCNKRLRVSGDDAMKCREDGDEQEIGLKRVAREKRAGVDSGSGGVLYRKEVTTGYLIDENAGAGEMLL